ncbi:MAG: hypothetical protein IJA10_09605 [Lachnospiraceae bacterium]|nr:hypothetical protein [Lachnospiraceae bacterium]
MAKRLRAYLAFMEKMKDKEMTEEERKEFLTQMLIQIQFFQHERFIHLIVTVCFALLLMLTLLGCILAPDLSLFALAVIIFGVLAFYIKHYYLLENGVQKLYVYYDQIQQKHFHVP